ncbi:hypothetical protein ABTK28_21135, partial [Acinetobacter baumannii]
PTPPNATNVALVRPFSSANGLTYGAQKLPDIVANLRVDQGWGSAQLMGALHQLTDYGSNFGATTGVGGAATSPTTNAGDKLGWAVG